MKTNRSVSVFSYLRKVTSASFAILALAALPAIGANTPDNTSENTVERQHAAEKQRETLRTQLKDIQHSIDQTSDLRNSAAAALARTESSIATAMRALADLRTHQTAVEKQVATLRSDLKKLDATIAQQQDQLSAMLRQQYGAGSEDRLKLLLSADNPNRINRELAYAGYISRAQAELLASLESNQELVHANTEQTQITQAELARNISEQLAQNKALQLEQARRSELLKQLSGNLQEQQHKAHSLAKDEQELGALVDKLGVIAEREAHQRRVAADKAAAAKAAADKALADKTAAAKNAGARRTGPQEEAMPDGKKDAPVLRNDQVPQTTETSGRSFDSLRGKLRLPLQGVISMKFGATRENGPASRGIFIRASEGAAVLAVADGKVVFSDYLRGFGNITILDHGNQYMTIYGNNQTNLKHPGDMVKAGETIAQAGNSGGNEQSGLYFEIRQAGHAVDPLTWVTIR